jgi:GDP-L-fucose synthase
MAKACLYLLEQPDETYALHLTPDSSPLINVGCGEDLTIRELAELVREVVGFTGKLTFDPSKPDGTMRKLLDVSKLKQIGWQATTPLRDGIVSAYETYLVKAS